MTGTIRARIVKSSGSSLLAIERVTIDGQPAERETSYWIDASEHYRMRSAPTCRLEGTTEARPCEGARSPEDPDAR
jgi:hypothetical protein